LIAKTALTRFITIPPIAGGSRSSFTIVAISGRFGGWFLHTVELLGAHATLAKPIRPEDLLDVVRRVLT